METYSGMKAEEITPSDMWRFVWREKGNLFRFLKWTSEIEKASVKE
jgi:hypothetical protein